MSSRMARYLIAVLIVGLSTALLANMAQAQTLTVLHTFTGGSDGSNPSSTLVMNSAGDLYGTAVGDAYRCDLYGKPSCGTVYELTNDSGTWRFTTLYEFQGGSDGAGPTFNVSLVGAKNTIVGTTIGGGQGTCLNGYGIPGCGTVFALPSAAKEDKVLYSFSGGTDGGEPASGVIIVHGNLYGETTIGGDLNCFIQAGCGTVYEVTPTGKEAVIYAFTGPFVDGAIPVAGLVADHMGNLYGVTLQGGTSTACEALGCGTIFELQRGQSGWTEKILYSFTNSTDGDSPDAALIFDNKGNLYGTTSQGGTDAGGTVFELEKSGGNWSVHLLYNFEWGAFPVSPLVMDSKGNIFGTTQGGGTNGWGRIFELTPNGNNWSYNELYDFTGQNDGGKPLGGLVLDSAGNLYGTTSCFYMDCEGAVFEFTP
jgi:uncharacterized repeat protein (TIGR03803 family)